MDANLFFKKATLLICSSLDVDVALWRLFQFIRDQLPADAIYLNIYEPSTSSIRYVAMADHHGGKKIEKSIPLPDSLIHAIESGERLQNYLVINEPEKDSMGRIITAELNLENHSFIALRLFIEKQRLGVIDLFAKGRNRFTRRHADRLSQLREPFAIAMANALKHQQLIELKEQLLSDNRYLNSELLQQSGNEVVGSDMGLKEVMSKVGQITHLKNTVLLLGETGTGKEVIANAIHRLSPRCNEPFIKVNCGAIPEDLIDSELFGHEKGAFTGAIGKKRGRFERAHGGTIFLDEIGELPPWAQVRLLRVLQTQEIERVGGSPPIKLDIRVIAATHRDLQQMVAEGKFRQDLWFRINMFPITIPPLRQRPQDIGPLTHFFIRKKSEMLGIQPIPQVAPEALEGLVRHTWPGNVRELENVIESSLIQHRQGPLRFQRQLNPSTVVAGGLLQQHAQVTTLDDAMRLHIDRALSLTDGKISGRDGAATLLGLHPNTLRNRMAKLNIEFGRKRGKTPPNRQHPASGQVG
ncbi:Transcriptional regulator containing GAF, AAA-type ATPase, and DNA-binding Fis domains [Desulforhopalus singaporensis]|uniref:Transcriptional regulator containing GAF, AAA-type ATPase, and DNA-binding Fis domains n=2 Tax=Desulforhopalus singaporensis TaxID=91360 RepID=A0A1H0IUX9_9BACT|nr:Transcriptional regulator containing GAF, AAA-type ATPase, and DNA-binding Fis domains [Desulforhopalus singaporensis]